MKGPQGGHAAQIQGLSFSPSTPKFGGTHVAVLVSINFIHAFKAPILPPPASKIKQQPDMKNIVKIVQFFC